MWQEEAREKILSLVGEESGDHKRKSPTCPKFTSVAEGFGVPRRQRERDEES